MREYIIQTLMGAIGSVGFALIFHMRGKQLLLMFLGGALAWAVYLLCTHFGCSEFLGVILAAMTANIISEILARVVHTPVLILLVPMLVPLIPGGALYRSMDAIIRGEKERFLAQGTSAITFAGAIALGIIATTALFRVGISIHENLRKLQRKQ